MKKETRAQNQEPAVSWGPPMVDTDWRRVAVERLRVIHNLVARLGSAEKQRDEMFLALADLRDAIRNGEDTTKPKPPCDPAVAK